MLYKNNIIYNMENLLSFAEELIGHDELKKALEDKKQLRFYDGFEPSGRMHIAQGLIRAHNVNLITQTGSKFIFWVADYFAQLNGKYGGDMEKIQAAGQLMIHIWKASGMNLDNVEFIWASQAIKERSTEYWSLVMEISRQFSIKRVKECSIIQGREESDNLMTSSLLYSIMQAVDVIFLNIDVASLGVDQRKVLMLNREMNNHPKPIVILHHMLLGLDGTKMSKSNPDNAIFMDDPPNEVKRKIRKAYCPEKIIENNPIIEYVKYIIFPKDHKLEILRPEKFGGNISFDNYDIFEKAYSQGEIFPLDLKNAITSTINGYLTNVVQYFETNSDANLLLQKVKSFNK